MCKTTEKLKAHSADACNTSRLQSCNARQRPEKQSQLVLVLRRGGSGLSDWPTSVLRHDHTASTTPHAQTKGMLPWTGIAALGARKYAGWRAGREVGDLGAHELEEEHLDIAVRDAAHAAALRRCAIVGHHGNACAPRPPFTCRPNGLLTK